MLVIRYFREIRPVQLLQRFLTVPSLMIASKSMAKETKSKSVTIPTTVHRVPLAGSRYCFLHVERRAAPRVALVYVLTSRVIMEESAIMPSTMSESSRSASRLESAAAGTWHWETSPTSLRCSATMGTWRIWCCAIRSRAFVGWRQASEYRARYLSFLIQ